MTSALERLRGDGPDDTTDDAAAEAIGSIGWLRGVRDRAIMLELRRRNGNILALSYASLESAAFNPSEGITLEFHNRTVRITGHNLNNATQGSVKLFEGIVRHRVPWLRESDKSISTTANALETVVTSVEW